jgi:hypothetical protein
MKEEHDIDKKKHKLGVLPKHKKGQGLSQSIKRFLYVVEAIPSAKEAIPLRGNFGNCAP